MKKPGTHTVRLLCLLLATGLIGLSACKKEDPLPPNPYDDVDYGGGGSTPYIPDPNEIVGLYENIFRVKCNNPGCHDGHFEPDFRSIQSAWSTLVYHDVVKNTADSAYNYRVVPGDTGASILWRRLTRGDAALQQMPATGAFLSQDELSQIQAWIDGGAKDMFGNMPVLPNNEPVIQAFLAFNQTFTQQLDVIENRLDSVPFNPFKISQGVPFNAIILVEDDSTAICDLQVNQLRLSLDKDDFSGATSVGAVCISQSGLDAYLALVQTSAYSVGDTVFMRYYVNDGDHSNDTEFPRDELPDAYKTYAAFYIQP